MKLLAAFLCLLAIVVPRASEAQNLVIINARIVDGKGGVVERGSVVVRDGKIVSAGATRRPPAPWRQRIDAQGRTLMPGFIDAHRHIVQGDPKEWLRRPAPRSSRSSSTPGSPRCCAPSAPTRPSRCGSGSNRAP